MMDDYSSLLAKWRDNVKLGPKLGEGLVSVVYAGMFWRKVSNIILSQFPWHFRFIKHTVAPKTVTSSVDKTELDQYVLKIVGIIYTDFFTSLFDS